MNTVGWIGLLISHLAAIGFGVFATLFFLEPKPSRKPEDTLTPAALAKRLMEKAK